MSVRHLAPRGEFGEVSVNNNSQQIDYSNVEEPVPTRVTPGVTPLGDSADSSEDGFQDSQCQGVRETESDLPRPCSEEQQCLRRSIRIRRAPEKLNL